MSASQIESSSHEIIDLNIDNFLENARNDLNARNPPVASAVEIGPSRADEEDEESEEEEEEEQEESKESLEQSSDVR